MRQGEVGGTRRRQGLAQQQMHHGALAAPGADAAMTSSSEASDYVARFSRCVKVRSEAHGVDMALDIDKCAATRRWHQAPMWQ